MEDEDLVFLLANMLKQKKPIAIKLVDKFNNEDFACKLFHLADLNFCNFIKFGKSVANVEIVLVALIYLAICKYDSNYWKYIREVFPISYSGDHGNEQKVDQLLRKLMKPYIEEVGYFDQESYIAVPLVLAGVMHSGIKDFFNFCTPIYVNNLHSETFISNSDLTKEVTRIFESLKHGKKLNYDDNTLKVANKTYALSKYTQYAIYSGINITDIISVAVNCIKIIMHEVNGDALPIDEFYRDGYEIWREEYLNNDNIQNKIKNERKTKEKLYFDGSDMDHPIVLQTASISADVNCDPTLIKILIFSNGDELTQTYDVDCDEGFEALIVKPTKIRLDCDVLNKFSYQIVYDGKVLYSSSDKLFSDVLFFDCQDGERKMPYRDFEGMLFAISKNEPFIGDLFYQTKFFYITQLLVTKEGKYPIDNVDYYFKTIIKPGLEGHLCDNIAFIANNGYGKTIPFYSSLNQIILESDLDRNDIVLLLDNEFIDEVHISTISEYENGIKQYSIDLSFIEAGYHELKVANMDAQILKNTDYNFVLDRTFNLKYKMKSDFEFYVSVHSNFLNDEITLKNTDNKYERSVYIKNLEKCKFILYPEFIRWSFNKSDWYPFLRDITCNEYEQCNQQLYIKGPRKFDVYCRRDNKINETKDNKPQLIKSFNNQTYYEESLISLNILNNYSNTYDRCNVIIAQENSLDHFVRVNFLPTVEKDNIIERFDQEGQMHHFKYHFDTNEEFEFKIFSNLSVKPIIEQKISNNKELTLPFDNKLMHSGKNYKISISKMCGLIKKDERIFYNSTYNFINFRRLQGTKFKFKLIKAGETDDTSSLFTCADEYFVSVEYYDSDNEAYVATIRENDNSDYAYSNRIFLYPDIEIDGKDSYWGSIADMNFHNLALNVQAKRLCNVIKKDNKKFIDVLNVKIEFYKE